MHTVFSCHMFCAKHHANCRWCDMCIPAGLQHASFADAHRVGAEGVLLLLAIFLHSGMPQPQNASASEGQTWPACNPCSFMLAVLAVEH